MKKNVGMASLALVVVTQAPPLSAADRAGALGDWQANVAAFRADLVGLRDRLDIPGLAYVVVRGGQILVKEDLSRRRSGDSGPPPLTTDTPLRIASVTKALTAVVVLQQVEAGALSLDTPVERLLPDFEGPGDVTVRHLLTHTSEGEVGREYVYSSSRYARLGDVLQVASGRRFEGLLSQGLLEKSGARVHDSPHLGAHAGLVSTVDDVAKLLQALDAGRLASPAAMSALETPSRTAEGNALPVSLGWFAQDVQGRRVVWSFGQDDPDHSGALLLRAPAHGLSLFVLANRNTLSDPFRLLMGDVRKSPVAMAFLRNFVMSPPGRPRPGLGSGPARQVMARLGALEAEDRYSYRDELLARALTHQWTGESQDAEALLFGTLDRYGSGPPDAVLHFLSLTIGSPRSRAWGIGEGDRLLASHPRNRWILFAQANLLAKEPSRSADAERHFRTILALANQVPDFLNRLFHAWCLTGIAELIRDTRREEAALSLRQAIDLKVGGGTEAEARRLLRELEAASRR